MNAMQLEAARVAPVFSALITTPCQVWSCWTIHCHIIAFCCWYVTLCCDSLWPSDFEHLQWIACDVMKLCTKSEHNRAIRGGDIAISIFDLMTLNDVFGSEIIFTKYDLWQDIRGWITAFLRLMRYVTLWPWSLPRWPLKVCGTSSVTWSNSVRNFSEIEQSALELFMISRFFATCYVALWPWLLTLNFHGTSIVIGAVLEENFGVSNDPRNQGAKGAEWRASKAQELRSKKRQVRWGMGKWYTIRLGSLGERRKLPQRDPACPAGNASWRTLKAKECPFGGQGSGLGAIAPCPNVKLCLIVMHLNSVQKISKIE